MFNPSKEIAIGEHYAGPGRAHGLDYAEPGGCKILTAAPDSSKCAAPMMLDLGPWEILAVVPDLSGAWPRAYAVSF